MAFYSAKQQRKILYHFHFIDSNYRNRFFSVLTINRTGLSIYIVSSAALRINHFAEFQQWRTHTQKSEQQNSFSPLYYFCLFVSCYVLYTIHLYFFDRRHLLSLFFSLAFRSRWIIRKSCKFIELR